jgi:hypothetical protein
MAFTGKQGTSDSRPGNIQLGRSGLTTIGGFGPTPSASAAVNVLPLALATSPVPIGKATNAVPQATARGS